MVVSVFIGSTLRTCCLTLFCPKLLPTRVLGKYCQILEAGQMHVHFFLKFFLIRIYLKFVFLSLLYVEGKTHLHSLFFLPQISELLLYISSYLHHSKLLCRTLFICCWGVKRAPQWQEQSTVSIHRCLGSQQLSILQNLEQPLDNLPWFRTHNYSIMLCLLILEQGYQQRRKSQKLLLFSVSQWWDLCQQSSASGYGFVHVVIQPLCQHLSVFQMY